MHNDWHLHASKGPQDSYGEHAVVIERQMNGFQTQLSLTGRGGLPLAFYARGVCWCVLHSKRPVFGLLRPLRDTSLEIVSHVRALLEGCQWPVRVASVSR